MEEVQRLCRVAASIKPAQRFDAETPAGWHVVLDDVTADDVRAVLPAVAKRDTWIDPSVLRAEAKRLRARRLEGADDYVPTADPEDVAAYLAELRVHRALVASTPAPAVDPAALPGGVHRRAITSGEPAPTPAPGDVIDLLRQATARDPKAITQRLPAVDPARDGQPQPRTRPAPPVKALTRAEIDQAEAHRRRQLALLADMVARDTHATGGAS
jgi:hypothetical protein